MKRYIGRRLVGTILTLMLPGVGHILLGQWRRAIFWLVVMIVVLAGTPYSATAMLAFLLMRLPCLLDLWLVRVTEPPGLVGAVVAVISVLITATFARTMLIDSYVEAYRMPSSSMSPTVEIGDHVIAAKRSLDPARGELVVFEHPCSPDKTFLKRVVGMPGDTIELRCDRLYVNGERAAAKLAESQYLYPEHDAEANLWKNVAAARYVESLDGRSYDTLHAEDRPARDLARNKAGRRDDYGPDYAGARDFPGETPPVCEGRTSAAVGTIETSKKKRKQRGPCAPQRHYVVPADHLFVLGDNRSNSADSRVFGAVPLANLEGEVRYIWWSSIVEDIRWDRLGAVH